VNPVLGCGPSVAHVLELMMTVLRLELVGVGSFLVYVGLIKEVIMSSRVKENCAVWLVYFLRGMPVLYQLCSLQKAKIHHSRTIL
jgi:hypothetical protein